VIQRNQLPSQQLFGARVSRRSGRVDKLIIDDKPSLSWKALSALEADVAPPNHTEFSPAFLPSPDLSAAEVVLFAVLAMRKHRLGLLGTMALARRLGWAIDHLEHRA
jgi:hypothetical protein